MTHLSAQSISSQTEDWALLKNLRGYMPKSSDTFLHPQLANTNRNKFHLPLNQDKPTSRSWLQQFDPLRACIVFDSILVRRTAR